METNDERLKQYNRDWLGNWMGKSKLALLPTNIDQVSKLSRYCNERKLAVVPQGGNTGLVGGSIPLFDEIVISLSKMNKIVSFDPNSSVVVTEAGVILEELSIKCDSFFILQIYSQEF